MKTEWREAREAGEAKMVMALLQYSCCYQHHHPWEKKSREAGADSGIQGKNSGAEAKAQYRWSGTCVYKASP